MAGPSEGVQEEAAPVVSSVEPMVVEPPEEEEETPQQKAQEDLMVAEALEKGDEEKVDLSTAMEHEPWSL
eukprot:7196577-Lingulodinium_polyedra.AAC.1